MPTAPIPSKNQLIADARREHEFDAYWTKERAQAALDATRAAHEAGAFVGKIGMSKWVREQYGAHGLEDIGGLKLLAVRYELSL